MKRIGPRWKGWHIVTLIGVPLVVIGLCGACMSELDDHLQPAVQPVSSSDQGSNQQQAERGVVGKVTSVSKGSPIPRVMIHAVSLDQPSVAIPERIVLSRKDGQYHWPLRPGRYELTASADGYQPMTVEVDIERDSLLVSDFALEEVR